MPPRPMTLARVGALAAALVGCDVATPSEPAAQRLCDGGCAPGLRCYAPTGECVLTGVASCAPACRAYEQCSARATRPTCYAQVCALPARPPSPVLKVLSVALLPSSAACDLDGDGAGDARLSELADAYSGLQQALDDGVAGDRITLLLRREASRLEVLFGTLATESLRCNPASPTAFCRYTITRESYDRGARLGPCPPWISLGDATLVDGAMRAGGPSARVGISTPIGAGHLLVQMLGVRADGPWSAPGGEDASATLRLCGAVPRADLLGALEGLPADALAPVGGLSGARSLASLALRADIDADGDRVAESVSFALRLTAARAEITGWSPSPP